MKKTNKGVQFEWPKYKSDKERIKAMTRIYADMSISDAFAKEYGLKLPKVSEEVNYVPQEVRVGQLIPVRITGIEKNHVDFDSFNLKSNLVSKANMFKYEKFKHFIPKDKIMAKVIKVDKDNVTVDPYGGMLDNWLNPIIANPNIQKNLYRGAQIIRVKNLKLTRGGFIGQAVIPILSEFVGEDYTIPAFIPGSQIVLNITDEFEKFEGQDVWAFVLNYIQRPGSDQMSLICSRKEYLKFQGEQYLIELFKKWCEDADGWSEMASKNVYDGKVTGVINSSKKCGVFVEIPDLNVTGMVSVHPSHLVNFKRNQDVKIRITGFDEEMYFNHAAGQLQHAEPYIIEDNCLEKCSLKPVLAFA